MKRLAGGRRSCSQLLLGAGYDRYKQNILKAVLGLVVTGLLSAYTYADEGESIVFNPTTGNYLITHYSPIDKKFEKLVFIPATKFSPTFKSKFKLETGGIIRYRYTLISGRDSQQKVIGLLFDPVRSVTTPLPDVPLNAPPGKIMGDMMAVAKYFTTPAPWRAIMSYSEGQRTFRIGWLIKVDHGLLPGNQAAFGFNSLDLPGIVQARIDGYAPDSQEIDGEELPDAQDGGFGQQYFALLNNNFLRRPAAVPAIAVPDPFNAATLLGSIQTQMHTWIAMNLLDATFSSQLDRYFESAINAYSHNQYKAAKEDIQTIHSMLMREHSNLDQENVHAAEVDSDKDAKHQQIDLLAAQVLDFDLKYVLKRSK